MKISVKAKSIFRENFRKGGYQDGGLHKWPTTRRQLLGGGADSKRGPMLSSRKVLYSSIRNTPSKGCVTIFSNVVYAGIHNDGGTVVTHPRVTDKMRRYAWAQYYKNGGSKKKDAAASDDTEMWKRLALTKKTKLTVRANIPKRQSMGAPNELMTAVSPIIETEVSKLINF
ncbi:MAG: hypothetical protein Q4G10_08480 [Bacteroidia bacterium]|nr:hypothetical protein [Bacteroidia bacterium]